jgi:hypothetical protein
MNENITIAILNFELAQILIEMVNLAGDQFLMTTLVSV